MNLVTEWQLGLVSDELGYIVDPAQHTTSTQQSQPSYE